MPLFRRAKSNDNASTSTDTKDSVFTADRQKQIECKTRLLATTPSPPPSYQAALTTDEPSCPAYASLLETDLDVQRPYAVPRSAQCTAHLKVLAAFHILRESIATHDGLFGIRDSSVLTSEPDDVASTTHIANTNEQDRVRNTLEIREKRWEVYVARAVKRFEAWWRTCVEADSIRHQRSEIVLQSEETLAMGIDLVLPPLDVLMIWHAYRLNPRDYLEDCIRYNKMKFWRTPFPWANINACIDNLTFEYTVDESTRNIWLEKTGHEWTNIEDPNYAIVKCPTCQKDVQVPWSRFELAPPSRRKDQVGGLADRDMVIACTTRSCNTAITHDALAMQKFRLDFIALQQKDYPMAGTVLNPQGLNETHLAGYRLTDYEFPNRLLLADAMTTQMVLAATQPILGYDLGNVRSTLEALLEDPETVKKVNDGLSNVPSTKRAAIRRMMSRYWNNASPFALDLIGATVRQGTFIEKMQKIDWLHSPAVDATMKRSILKYERFIAIMTAHPTKLVIPTLDVDLAWHTHQLAPSSYYTYTTIMTRRFVNHDDKIEEGTLSTAFEWTSSTYQTTFHEIYSECTCWYCEAIRASHASNAIVRAFSAPSSKSRAIKASLADLDSKLPHDKVGAHISAHNAIRPKWDPQIERTAGVKALVQKAKLDASYQKACAHARRRGRPVPQRDTQHYDSCTYAGGYISVPTPYYAPYMVDPCISGDQLYPTAPACATLVDGASGNCCQGTCGGTLAAGGCVGGGTGGANAGGGDGGGDAGDGSGCSGCGGCGGCG